MVGFVLRCQGFLGIYQDFGCVENIRILNFNFYNVFF